MTINEMIQFLEQAKEKIGGDTKICIANDYDYEAYISKQNEIYIAHSDSYEFWD